jgi:AcrR family transcriptional regulator
VPKVTGGSVVAHREATRAAIFTAFARLVYERGYDTITLADVAGAAGMSRTTMYNYFPDKDALAVAYAEHEVDVYVKDLRSSIAAADNPVDQLRTYIRQQLTYFSTHHLPPGRALQMVLPTTTYQRVVHHVHLLEEVLLGILRAGAAQGYFADDIEAAMPLVAACINRGGPTTYDGTDLNDEIELTENFVLRALGARLTKNGEPLSAEPTTARS